MKTPSETAVVPAVDGKEEPEPNPTVPSGKKVSGKKTPKTVTKKLPTKKARKAVKKAARKKATKVAITKATKRSSRRAVDSQGMESGRRLLHRPYTVDN
jgi:hypothetical protein